MSNRKQKKIFFSLKRKIIDSTKSIIEKLSTILLLSSSL